MTTHEEWLTDPASGARHYLRLWTPDGTPPAKGFPLLIMLDGDWTWPMLQHPPQAELDRCAVLALGYNVEPDQVRSRRALDYTPPAPDGGMWVDPRVPSWQCGGAPAMLAFITGPIRAWLAHHADIDQSRTTLYGHSYGALFTLYALAMRPSGFRQFVCASPSLWWHEQTLWHMLDRLRDAPSLSPVDVTIIASSDERWHATPAPRSNPNARTGGIPTLPRNQALQDCLNRIDHLHSTLEVQDGPGHGALLPLSARRALTLAALT